MNTRILFPAFLLLFHLLPTFGQTPNLSIVLDTSLSDIKVGQFFAVTGRIQLTNGNPVPSGQTIVATVELFAPDGIRVGNPHIQTWNGYDPRVNDGTLSNDGNNDRVLFQIPWSQAQKPLSGWRVQARVEGAGLETDLSDNVVATDPFNMILPDLIISTLNLTTDNRDNLFLSSGTITANGVVRNDGDARTQESILFPLVARLFRFDGSEPIGPILDSETIIIPSPEAGGFPYIDERDNLRFSIPNLQIPEDALPGEAFVVTVTVDPSDLRFGDIIHETQDNAPDSPNNGNDQTFHINFTVSQTATANIQINANSFEGDTGSFRGLDPIRIAFSIRNSGLMPIQPNEDFTARVALSKDLIFHNENSPSPDFILREFDLGGNALGTNLLPNESITLDWVQQLPDNLEGDFYYLVNVEETGQTFNLDNTPSISLSSNFRGSTDLVEGPNNNNLSGGERPHTTTDGRYAVYEKSVNNTQQIYLFDLLTNSEPVLVSQDYISGSPANGDSFRPRISGDGTTVVYHSKASNLVPGDLNNLSDVFLYRVQTGETKKTYNFLTFDESDGNSFYPDVNYNGTKVVFESSATNLESNGSTSFGKQIFLWDTNTSSGGDITAITKGNGSSFSPSIDNQGNAIVYMSEATNIPVADLFGQTSTDSNGKADIFLHFLDTNLTYLANLNNFKDQTNTHGFSDQPMISGDGTTIVYRSTATNLVQEKGISFIEVENGGVGYNGNPTLLVTDLNLTGSGAILDFQVNGIDSYGQIMANAIRILDHGENYTNPIITVIPDPNFEIPAETAKIKAHLTHPEGEIYMISVADILNLSASNERKYSVRVSENIDQVGGNSESREPSVSDDGSTIVFSTKSSNFLDSNITRSDGEVFYNSPITAAEAKAILVGGIGEIEVDNPGSGYQNGFLFINDISGNGSGASASYQVDALGRISSVKIVDPGSGYDLETTFVSVDNPRGGTGFLARATTFFQGGRVHRIEMLEHGSGYQDVASTNSGKQGLITIDGDGSDQNGNGKPTAKINSERVKINPQGGGIYIEQIVDVELLSKNSLLNTSITFSDYQKTVTFSFAQANTSATTIGIFGKTLGDITSEIIDAIESQWSPNPIDLFQGPSIPSIISGSTGFSFHGLSGKVETDNPTAFNITYQTNMLIGGSGFTRANPIIAPSPIIHGYSEVVSGTNVVNVTNGRGLYMPVVDHETDDIYLYTVSDKSLERVSKSTFGLPINYLSSSTSTMPSNRFPSISGDGRHIFFSSDASGRSGLAFSNTNQSASDNNTVRDIYHHDRKTASEVSTLGKINFIFPKKDSTYSFSPQTSIPVIVDYKISPSLSGLVYGRVFINGKVLPGVMSQHGVSNPFSPTYSDFLSHRFDQSVPNNSTLTGINTIQVAMFDSDTNEQIAMSDQISVNVDSYAGFSPTIELQELPFSMITDTSSLIISARSRDIDAALESLQFFINGEPAGGKIYRTSGSLQSDSIYQLYHEPNATGTFSVHAISSDNSGNYVASFADHFTVTNGSVPAAVDFSGDDLVNFELLPDIDFSVKLFESNGSIESITLLKDVDAGFSAAGVKVLGTGTSAVAIPNIDASGKIDAINISYGGSGYEKSSLRLKVVPVRRVLRTGTPAEITTTWYDTDWDIYVDEEIITAQLNSMSNNAAVINQQIQENIDNNRSSFTPSIYGMYGILEDMYTTYTLKKRFDGTPLGGEGYVVAPLFFPVLEVGQGQETITLDRLPLAPATFGTSSVMDFVHQKDGVFRKGSITGGFTRAPIYVNIGTNNLPENIYKVSLSVDGKIDNQHTTQTPPYSFSWVAENARDYSLSAVAQDYDGNIIFSQPTIVSVAEYSGSGIIARFDGEQKTTVQVGSEAMFSVLATSEFGIQEVEFYLNGQSIGFAKPSGDGRYSYVLNFSGFEQGVNVLSFNARDFAGNESGTHDPSITNISEFKHKEITIVASADQDAPTISAYPLPEDSNLTTLRFKMGEVATVNLAASADQDGMIDRVYLYSNGRMLQTTDGEFFIQYDPSSSLHVNGIFPFQFMPMNTGTFNLVASAIDSFGAQAFSTENMIMEVVNNASSSPLISMVFPQADMSISSTSEIRLVATASDPDDSLIGVQFYVNGKKYGDQILYDKSKPMANYIFGINWSPEGVPGAYFFAAMAIDSSGNEAYSPAVVVNATQGNEYVPNISLSPISPFYATGSDVSILATASDEANSSTGFGFIEEVRYFVNGRQQGAVDTQFPYYYNWVPMQKGRYQIHAQVRDNEGNYRISEVVSVEVTDAEKVSLEISRIGEDLATNRVADGTKVSIPVIATGTHGGLQALGQVTLQVNGEFYGSQLGTRNLLPSGLIGSITYNFEWLANYDDYLETAGVVTFAATGGNPQISSNVESVEIPVPSPWLDPSSAAGSIFSDLTGSGASLEELNDFSKISSGSSDDFAENFINWIGTSDSSMIQDRVDVIAVYHIAHGDLHPNYSLLMEDFSRIGQSNDWLKDYVNEILSGPDYLNKYNSVPYLVGSYGSSNIEDFDSNRKRFFRRCFSNKFGSDPSNAQTFQGSRRMLYFWESFESDYWEINGIVPLGVQPKDSPPRRDTVPPNNYSSGECAVDLVYNLARELPFEGGFPFIQSTSNQRETFYLNALFLYSIFKTSVANFTTEEKAEILALQSRDALHKILSDYRYTSRFNYLWLNSPKPDNVASSLSHWKEEDWFGVFMDKFYPWIYHTELGWVYTPFGSQKYDPSADLNGFWAFSDQIGWWWSFDQAFSLSKYTGYVFLNDYSQWADLDASNGEISRYRLWKDGVPGTWNTLSD